MITSFQMNGQPLNLDVNTYNIDIHIFFFYRPHDNIGQSRYQHWYWYCWGLNWYALYYAVAALNYWREESVKWTSFVIMYLFQAPGNGVKYSEANSALLIPRDSRQSKKQRGNGCGNTGCRSLALHFPNEQRCFFRLSSCSKCSESQWLQRRYWSLCAQCLDSGLQWPYVPIQQHTCCLCSSGRRTCTHSTSLTAFAESD